MEIKRIFLNSLWFGIFPKVTTLVNVIILPFITPYLTPYDYGIYGIITAFSGIFSIISGLGLNIFLTNSYYTHSIHFNKVWGRILAIILISGLFFSIVFGIILFNSLQEIELSLRLLIIILSCFPILLQANTILANHYYPLIYSPKPLVLRNLIASLFGIFVTFIFIYNLKLGFIGWIAGSSISALLGFILFVKPLWIEKNIKPVFSIKRKRLIKWIIVALPIIPHSIGFTLLSSSDRIIMKILAVPIENIGIYSNGYQIGSYITLITTAMITAISPKLQELYRSNNFTNLRNLFIFTQIITATGIFLFSLWMPQLYDLLIRNKELQSASSIAIYISFANIVFPFYSIISLAAFIEEKTKNLLWIVFLPGVVNIILNFIFIPMFGYVAAAFTTLASYWIQLTIPIFIKYYREKIERIFISKTIIIYLSIAYFTIFSITMIAVSQPIIIKFIISTTLIACILISILKMTKFNRF